MNYLTRHIFLLVLVTGTQLAMSQLTILSALCENKQNPLGTPLSGLRFSWELDAKDTAQQQTAYQLVLSGKGKKNGRGTDDVWTSGIVKSSQSILVTYGGPALAPGTTYFWKVRVWDKHNRPSAWSRQQQLITGLFSTADWAQAKWIGYEDLPDSMNIVPGVEAPENGQLGQRGMKRPVVPLFRKNFSVSKKISTATAFVCGLGQYELSINGKKVGDDFLSPGWTYYEKKCLYNVFDVTGLLTNGDNTIGAIVGNGFYNINRERYVKLVVAFGLPKLICRVKIMYIDGSVKDIVSDGSWKMAPSPVTFTSIYGGEDYDAQLEQQGWNTSSFDDASWKNALSVQPPGGQLLPEQDAPLKVLRTFDPVKTVKTGNNFYVYDFGQNCSGIVELTVKGKKGQTVKLVPAELLTREGLANQRASGDPYYFSYTLKGEGEETWRPRFTYYGLRYVQVQGAKPDTAATNSDQATITHLALLHTRNSSRVNGSFECSNDLFNRIYTLINWAIQSNFQSVVTDCPHREKLGWLEEDYLMGNSIHYNLDNYQLYKKIVLDMMDAQLDNGLVPDIAPEFVPFSYGFRDSPEWGSASVILPWLLYAWYGDKDILQQAYPMMKKYVGYLESKSAGHILSHGLGDWYDYGPNPPGEAQLTPKALTATAIYYYDVKLLSNIAGALSNNKDGEQYTTLAEKIGAAFNTKFYNPRTHVYSTGSQTAMAMPLNVGLTDEKDRSKVLENLVDSIRSSGMKLTAGDIGFHFLVSALDEGGASQLIYDMNNRKDVAGYGYQLKKGATSLTESWNALEEVSNNHLMLGHIMEWFYSGLAGISQMPNSIAYRHIKIRPQPVGDIHSAKGSFHSPYGWIRTDWEKTAEKFILRVEIPVNARASVYLPATGNSKLFVNNREMGSKASGSGTIEVGSGKWVFELR